MKIKRMKIMSSMGMLPRMARKPGMVMQSIKPAKMSFPKIKTSKTFKMKKTKRPEIGY